MLYVRVKRCKIQLTLLFISNKKKAERNEEKKKKLDLFLLYLYITHESEINKYKIQIKQT